MGSTPRTRSRRRYSPRSLTILSAALVLALEPCAAQEQDTVTSDFDVFPFVAYDTNTGFGLGARAFLLGYLGQRESFDLILFGSTKGERWVRLGFSVPDLEVRQGAVYPVSVDVVVDYDKYLSYNFFGIGNGSSFDDREIYSREVTEVSLTVSRGVSETFVAQAIVRYRAIRNFSFAPESVLRSVPPPENASRADLASLQLSLRYDTRNSYIRPSHGLVLLGEAEFAPRLEATTSSGARYAIWVHHYLETGFIGSVLALRGGMQVVDAAELPVQFHLSLGSSNTLRGYLQDRFLDRVALLVNGELRFTIVGRLGGIAGVDAGKVWSRPGEIDLNRWAYNLVAGLRWNMDTFVVRGDVGWSRETLGLYLNFGHVF